jgi:hypothetical protein
MVKETQPSAHKRQEKTLEDLLREYKDVLEYERTLKRSIESFPSSALSPESPYRYTQLAVGDAILSYLGRQTSGHAASIDELIEELDKGNIVWGAMRTQAYIVKKAVTHYVKHGQMVWADAKQTKVKLPKQ